MLRKGVGYVLCRGLLSGHDGKDGALKNLHGGGQQGSAALVRGLGGACPSEVGGRRHETRRNIFGDGGDARGVGHGVDDVYNDNCSGLGCHRVELWCPVGDVASSNGTARWGARAGARHCRYQGHFWGRGKCDCPWCAGWKDGRKANTRHEVRGPVTAAALCLLLRNCRWVVENVPGCRSDA